ncbi:hypothetical protein AB0G60_12750 [Streptomyces angustmyceticus]|uniref:Uncharacterized protein n=1 Tax=Streptomyces angustmyceticus TaxID=285578 RepID=A0A5J4LJW1_9ACTN|nr:hypothetical protein [Streptomyces angustmyceticus]UAL68366.1 hypothetical protein K7396_19060 [Streptomyces angustmyceticus]GES31839.1 hypothetical protein San01_43260 [Streptomyces angustmyceticus]
MDSARDRRTPTTHTGSTLRGLRISRVPGKPVQREDDGQIAIHLWLRRDGAFDGDVALRLAPGEAELLHAQLCYALDDPPVTVAAPTSAGPASEGPLPDCRRSVQKSQGVRHL